MYTGGNFVLWNFYINSKGWCWTSSLTYELVWPVMMVNRSLDDVWRLLWDLPSRSLGCIMTANFRIVIPVSTKAPVDWEYADTLFKGFPWYLTTSQFARWMWSSETLPNPGPCEMRRPTVKFPADSVVFLGFVCGRDQFSRMRRFSVHWDMGPRNVRSKNYDWIWKYIFPYEGSRYVTRNSVIAKSETDLPKANGAWE